MLRLVVLLTLLVGAFAQQHTGRIVGGQPIEIEQAPWTTANLRNDFGAGVFNQACGGTLFRYNAVISAAHCYQFFFLWDYSHPSYWQIRTGSKYRNEGGIVSRVTRILNHPGYNSNTVENDISILTLEHYLTPTVQVATLPLPQQGFEVEANKLAFITGWGTTSFQGQASNVLQAVQVPIVDREECNRLYSVYSLAITADMLCAGDVENGGIDACQGDSGGPLSLDGTLQGITSWGNQCALPGFPGVYTRVAYFGAWIENNVPL